MPYTACMKCGASVHFFDDPGSKATLYDWRGPGCDSSVVHDCENRRRVDAAERDKERKKKERK